MFRTRAAGWRTAGIAAAVLATGAALLGLTGPAKADTNLQNVYCYKNPPGSENPDRIYVSRVAAAGPDSNGLYTLTWRTETQLWVSLGSTYANPTNRWVNWSLGNATPDGIAAIQSDPGTACTSLVNRGSGSDYVYGEWG
jgi:hypothetical protein